jgi:5'-nucleotidase
MQFLLTNDDGIDSAFLHVIIRALRDAGHDLFVVAPKTEQSWIGAAKSRHRPVRSDRAAHDFGCPAWTVDGTPADCVNIALAHLLPAAPDAVVSGINIGYNASLGFILASGTIGGAWEGALHGLPGIALSQHIAPELYETLRLAQNKGGVGEPGVNPGLYEKLSLAQNRPDDPGLAATLEATSRRAAALIPGLVRATPPRSFIVHNLNFPYPCNEYSEVRRTVPARVLVTNLFTPQPAASDNTTADSTTPDSAAAASAASGSATAAANAHHFIYRPGEDITPPDSPLTDRAAIAAGHISHTILDYTKIGQM